MNDPTDPTPTTEARRPGRWVHRRLPCRVCGTYDGLRRSGRCGNHRLPTERVFVPTKTPEEEA